MSESTNRLYECGFILVPTIPESEVPQTVSSLKALVTSAGGTITSEGTPEFIDLAYTMERTIGSKKSKYSQGYFGFIKFETSPESLEQLKKALDGDANIVRYILIKTNSENTIVFKKPKVEAKRGVEINEEELLENTESVDDIIEAHEALPDLLPEIEMSEKEEA